MIGLSKDTRLHSSESMLERLRGIAAFQQAAKTPEGRAVLERLYIVSGAGKSCFRPGDPNGTAFACGLRDAYLLLEADLLIDVSREMEKLKTMEEHNGLHRQR